MILVVDSSNLAESLVNMVVFILYVLTKDLWKLS